MQFGDNYNASEYYFKSGNALQKKKGIGQIIMIFLKVMI